MNLRPLYGMLIVSRDPDVGVYQSKDRKVLLHMPDVERIRTQTGFVHIHCETAEWNERPLDGKRILFSKYTEREFKIGGREFCTVDERDVLAVFPRSTKMKKATLLDVINTQLGLVEGDELSGSDLTAIAEEVSNLAEDEIGVEDDDDSEDVEEETDVE